MGLFKKAAGVLFGKQGKSKSTQQSGNHAYGMLSGSLSPALGYLTGSGNMIGSLLGIGGGTGGTPGQTVDMWHDGIDGNAKAAEMQGLPTSYTIPGTPGAPGAGGQADALSNFANSAGMGFLMDEGVDKVNSNFYARGLGQSGAAMKGLEKYRHGLASTYLNQYMDHLFNFGKLGLGAAGVLSDAGRYSIGESSEKAGTKGIAGDIIGAIAMCDPRLKTNVEYAGRTDEGVDMYYFDYKSGRGLPEGRFYGPMADQLAVIRPDAIATKDGYLAVTDKDLFPKRIA